MPASVLSYFPGVRGRLSYYQFERKDGGLDIKPRIAVETIGHVVPRPKVKDDQSQGEDTEA